jgi:hypothetical protein
VGGAQEKEEVRDDRVSVHRRQGVRVTMSVQEDEVRGKWAVKEGLRVSAAIRHPEVHLSQVV